jgi:hypothetical protein
LSKIILFGERSLRRAMSEYVAHYHAERNHQGKSNALLFHQVRDVKSPCNVARGWVGSCVITIKTLRELAADTEANALLMTRTAGALARQLP